jgi:hypothetical protein
MQFTLESLKAVEPSLVKLLKENLPIRISYQLSKLYEIIEKEMSKVEMLRQDLVKRYGKEESDGNIKVTEENLNEFNKEFFELMSIPVDGGPYEPISIDSILTYSERMEVTGKPPVNLSAIDLHQLKMVGILKGE